MRETIKNYLEAEKIRREEEGEKGFSLIELIIVVVILGILVAVAIPLIGGLQAAAEQSAADAAAANAATVAAAEIAQGGTATDLTDAQLGGAGTYTFTGVTNSLDTLCVTAEDGDIDGGPAGPGC